MSGTNFDHIRSKCCVASVGGSVGLHCLHCGKEVGFFPAGGSPAPGENAERVCPRCDGWGEIAICEGFGVRVPCGCGSRPPVMLVFRAGLPRPT